MKFSGRWLCSIWTWFVTYNHLVLNCFRLTGDLDLGCFSYYGTLFKTLILDSLRTWLESFWTVLNWLWLRFVVNFGHFSVWDSDLVIWFLDLLLWCLTLGLDSRLIFNSLGVWMILNWVLVWLKLNSGLNKFWIQFWNKFRTSCKFFRFRFGNFGRWFNLCLVWWPPYSPVTA